MKRNSVGRWIALSCFLISANYLVNAQEETKKSCADKKCVRRFYLFTGKGQVSDVKQPPPGGTGDLVPANDQQKEGAVADAASHLKEIMKRLGKDGVITPDSDCEKPDKDTGIVPCECGKAVQAQIPDPKKPKDFPDKAEKDKNGNYPDVTDPEQHEFDYSYKGSVKTTVTYKANLYYSAFKDVKCECKDKKGVSFTTPQEETAMMASGAAGATAGAVPAPATDRSLTALVGRPELFVAGEVASEDRMLVTVRGTNTIEGVVVSAEANGRKTEARTDSKGHAILDIAAIAGGGTAVTIGIVKALDSGGHELVPPAKTTITPTGSTVASPPEVPTLNSSLLQNGHAVTIPGKNLGLQSQLVVGNRAQETLSASSKELTSFVDAPALGPQPAYVRNSHGSSPTQTVHCYNFTVAASQTTIVRGQHVMVTGQYEGLPPRSRIEFTNATPTVVKMNVHGGRNHGEQGSCTVSKAAGTCEVELTGRGQGAFVINYKVEPPQ